MRILLLTPPMTQLNTPYPATAYLKGFLKKRGYEVDQADPAIELVLRIFSVEGLTEIKEILLKRDREGMSPNTLFFLKHQEKYLRTIDAAVRFLQGRDPSIALRIISREFLPEGARFRALSEGADPQDPDPISWAFGTIGIQDRAKYLASLYLDDLADVIRESIDPRFELSRYAEKLAASIPTFDSIYEALRANSTLVERYLDEITDQLLEKFNPQVVGLTVPFPGNVYGAFRIAQRIKERNPQVTTLMGGGYVNTELRQLSDPRVFDFIDFISLDDGEKPFLCILEYLSGLRKKEDLMRTFRRGECGKVIYVNAPLNHDIPHKEVGAPCYEGLPLQSYLSLFEMLNPVHRIWSDGRWNKLTLAHGCYWKKCNFCDINLDYIGRYDPVAADLLVDRIEQVIRDTGQTGFHFVDEAAPPAVLKALAQRLIERRVVITWWGNVRFEKTFTPELTRLLAQSGCVAVSGGLEVASDRILKLMNKGVTVDQVARVSQAFTRAGIMVHAYLMYGFPTQTAQETVDSLERVRQMFQEGCLQSAHWHRFSVTAHSPIGRNPEKYGIRILPEPQVTFARNDLDFEDPSACDHSFLGEGLRKALYNYMHGVGLDMDVRIWFGKAKPKIPAPKVPVDLIQRALVGA